MRCDGSIKGRFTTKRSLDSWEAGKISVNKAVAVCSKMRPCSDYLADVLYILEVILLIGPSIRLSQIIVSYVADIIILISGSTMGANTKVLYK